MAECTGCGKGIVWLKTKAGNNMPVDIETTIKEDTEFDPKRHISHFATCSQANMFRRKTNAPTPK